MTASLGLGAPIWVDAADFGWCHRRRLIWCDAFWPAEWCQMVTDEYDLKGWFKLSVPRRRRLLPALGSIFKSHFQPSVLPRSGTADHPEGRFPVITSPLSGQTPHGFARSSEEARERCQLDGCRLPYYWYETGVLLWSESVKGTWSWRTPVSDELELLMGFPAGHIHVPLDPDGKKSVKLSEDSRHRLLANSWHVPVP